MHVALTISTLQTGGAERIMTMLANYWIISGHRVSLINFESIHQQPFYSLHADINLIQLNLQDHQQLSPLRRLWNIIKRIYKLRCTLKNFQPDVIVSFVDMMNMTTLLASLGCKIPVIVSERISPFSHKLPSLYN